jgi:hypothetical protein
VSTVTPSRGLKNRVANKNPVLGAQIPVLRQIWRVASKREKQPVHVFCLDPHCDTVLKNIGPGAAGKVNVTGAPVAAFVLPGTGVQTAGDKLGVAWM